MYLLDGVSGNYLLKLVVLSLGESKANGGINSLRPRDAYMRQ